MLADYVQQYNTASLRPAVQQTYRGTPPPARRPVDVYTARPVVSADDYDDALIQGQVFFFFHFPCNLNLNVSIRVLKVIFTMKYSTDFFKNTLIIFLRQIDFALFIL